MSFLSNRKSELGNAFNRFKKKDFSGDTGIALKNTSYNFATTFTAKIGSLLFTIILARALMPELFGLYSLTLSTIVLFSVFTDFGIGTALIQKLSKEFSKNKGSKNSYYAYFFKLKIYATFLAGFLLLALAYFIANVYYQKPIYLALLAGIAYLAITSLMNFYASIFSSLNDFRKIFVKEIIFQVSRIIMTFIIVYFFLKLAPGSFLFIFFLLLSFCYFLSLLYLIFNLPKFKKEKELSYSQKSKLLRFMLPLTVTGLAGVFFGYVDMFILGGFVESEFIGYYQAALALVSSIGVLAGFSSALFPLFSRLSGKRLEDLLKKSNYYTIFIAIIGIGCTFFLADLAIKIVYGTEYLPAVQLLKIMSLILLFDPLIAMYSNYFISQGKSYFMTGALIFSTVMNIILNLFFITLLLPNQLLALEGAAVATIFAKLIHLIILVSKWKYSTSKPDK